MRCSPLALGFVWGLWSAAALAVDLPPPKVGPRVSPASVAELGLTGRIAVDRLKTSMLVGDDLGHVAQGVFCTGRQPVRVSEETLKNFGSAETAFTTQLLKKLGYPMASLGESSAFSADVAASPDFRVGGIVREIRLETCRVGAESEGWIYIKVDWALYAEKEQKVVLQQTTEGLSVSDKRTADLFRTAVTSAAENFIGNPAFLNAIQPDAAARLAAGGAAGVRGAGAKAAEAVDTGMPAVTLRKAISARDQGLAVKLGLEPLKVALLAGDEIGTVTSGMFCNNRQPMIVGDPLLKNYGNFAAGVTLQVLRKNGYPLAGLAKANAFDNELAAAPDFKIGGVVRGLRMEICQAQDGAEGWIYVKVDWAVYAEKAKRVVFQRSTEGLAMSKDRVPDLPGRAVAAAVENLLASPELLAVLKAPPPAVEAAAPSASAASGALASAAEPAGALRLAGASAPEGGAQKNQARLRAAVVTVETASGSGSGFYIDRTGYLMTDFHVVKGSKFVRLKMANGDKLVAQVVKVSERDDVALLKSEAVDLEPLAIRPDVLDVGEEVYAIGTPLGVLSSTMTRGVLSADRVIQGTHVLQSDAAVTFGSSGGPLLDGQGRVIGLAKSVLNGGKGFNFFIPVLDALRSLELTVGAAR